MTKSNNTQKTCIGNYKQTIDVDSHPTLVDYDAKKTMLTPEKLPRHHTTILT